MSSMKYIGLDVHKATTVAAVLDGSGKLVGSYLGLIPCEDSSADHWRLGHISKQGNSLVRYLLAEAAQAAARSDPQWRRQFLHLALRRERRIAKVAMARKLAVCLFWMWRNGYEYAPMEKFGSHAGQPGNPLAVTIAARRFHQRLKPHF